MATLVNGAWKRYDDTLMGQKAYGVGRSAPMLNLDHGGMNGHMPDYPAYISNTPYVRRNLVVRLLAAPRGFQYLPDPEKWIATLKALLETHPQSVEGFNNQLRVEVRETTFGGAGEMQEAVANVTRERVNPVFNYVEKYGRPITWFYDRWVTELLMDPNSKVPNVITRTNGARSKIIDLLPDFTSATIIAFEPDPTFTKIDKAWLVADMKPKEQLAMQEGKRDIHNGGELVEFGINFTGVAQTGPGVDALALKLLSSMTLAGANPSARNAFTQDIAGDVKGVGFGYAEQLQQAAADTVQV